MKAIQIEKHGSPDVLNFSEINEPICCNNKIKIQINACAINHLDIWVRRGFYNHVLPLPMILGSDGSGTIIEVGKDVNEYQIGDDIVVQPGLFDSSCEVAGRGMENFSNTYGILGETENGVQSEYVVLNPENIYLKPQHLSYEEAAGMQLVFMTSHQMIVSRANLQKHETILIYGGSSGVGSAAIQIAKDIGSTVIATVGSENKIKHAYNMGADYVINHNNADLKSVIKDLCKKNGVDVVFEHIGLDTWKNSLSVLNKGGRIVVCGATSGNIVNINLNHLFIKQQSIIGSTMSSISTFEEVMNKINKNIYRPFIDKVFRFKDVKDAHIRLENREQIGKIILIP